jgi:hypothetical protein
MTIKKRVALICTAFLTLSIAIVTTSVMSYPQEAKALVTSTYNINFNGSRTLPNGYNVNIVGVGFQEDALAYVASSVNAAVSVQKVKPTRSVFKSIRIIHQTRAYGLIGLNGFGRVANFDMVQECQNQYCTIQRYKSELATSVYMETGLVAQIEFNDGSYAVQSDKQLFSQR